MEAERVLTNETATSGLLNRALSYEGVTALTSLSQSTIRRLVKAGKLPKPFPLSTGRVAFREEDIRAFLARAQS